MLIPAPYEGSFTPKRSSKVLLCFNTSLPLSAPPEMNPPALFRVTYETSHTHLLQGADTVFSLHGQYGFVPFGFEQGKHDTTAISARPPPSKSSAKQVRSMCVRRRQRAHHLLQRP